MPPSSLLSAIYVMVCGVKNIEDWNDKQNARDRAAIGNRDAALLNACGTSAPTTSATAATTGR
jgi:hypothetical protein